MTTPRGPLPRPLAEALRAFAQLEALLAEIARGADTAERDADPVELARTTQRRLRRLLIDSGAPETPPARLPPVDLPYVLACHADEALIRLVRWPGPALWPAMLLERELYGAERAGERLPETATRMLERHEPARAEAAAALFMAFAAGFRGGLVGAEGARQAERLKAGLYDLAMGRVPPSRLAVRERFSQAVAHTLPTPRQPRPRSVERAAAALGLVVVAYLALSHLVWTSVHAEVFRLADRVTLNLRWDRR